MGVLRRRRSGPGGLTGRALVLGAVMVLLALVLASPLQRYLQERQSLSQSQQKLAQSSERVRQLTQLKAQWNDPAFVEAQARARLQYARPGDTVYVVVDPSHPNGDASADQNAPVTATSGPSNWRVKAWTSLQVADAAQ
jgi:cell division protein FtsB